MQNKCWKFCIILFRLEQFCHLHFIGDIVSLFEKQFFKKFYNQSLFKCLSYWNILFWWFFKVSYKNYIVYCSFLSVKYSDFQILISWPWQFHNFFLNWSVLIENWKNCFLETIYIIFIKSTGFYICLKFIIIKYFIITRGLSFWNPILNSVTVNK